MSKTAYIFFGKSGSGKGTQAELLIEYLDQNNQKAIYIETGARLRSFIEKGTYISGLVDQTLNHGGLLPEFLPITMWCQALIEEYTGSETLVLDGVSRRPDEAPILKNALDYIGIEKVFVLNINVSDTWSTERLLGRGRSDDNENEIKKRLEWFTQNTAPVFDYFKHETNFIDIEINGEQTIEQVHTEIVNEISKN